jgi:predicted urease superfamily metal-dependent hydrolase
MGEDMAKTLLEAAKELAAEGQPHYQVSEESVQTAELMAAWVMGAVDNYQVAKIMQLGNAATVAQKVGPVLRELGRFGMIEIIIHRNIHKKP